MSEKTNIVESNVEVLDINIDEIFSGAPAGGDVISATEEKPKTNNILKGREEVDFSFTEPESDVDDLNEIVSEDSKEEVESKEETNEVELKEDTLEEVNNIIDSIDNEDTDEEIKQKRGRKPISGISDVFSKLISSEKIVPFDDEKPLEDYSAKDWEELIEANLEEKANQVRRETPKQFFESLPQELQVAARYVADGGQDLKGLFSTLAYVEESKELDVTKENDQERIITEYLGATGYGTSEEIQEEIEIWKDLGKLEAQASKFKPKLDKMQEKIIAQKLEEQEMKKKQQEQASAHYMQNVYDTLKDGTINDIKIDKKTQAMLYNGLVQPAYPSVSGKNTNLLGHLLEKYQFVEPNYSLISEALWLLQDPKGYKEKIMSKGAQQNIEQTVRKLKTEQSNRTSNSLGTKETEPVRKSKPGKKLQRTNNIFKRI